MGIGDTFGCDFVEAELKFFGNLYSTLLQEMILFYDLMLSCCYVKNDLHFAYISYINLRFLQQEYKNNSTDSVLF